MDTNPYPAAQFAAGTRTLLRLGRNKAPHDPPDTPGPRADSMISEHRARVLFRSCSFVVSAPSMSVSREPGGRDDAATSARGTSTQALRDCGADPRGTFFRLPLRADNVDLDRAIHWQ